VKILRRSVDSLDEEEVKDRRRRLFDGKVISKECKRNSVTPDDDIIKACGKRKAV
jgi:hypothetical protein